MFIKAYDTAILSRRRQSKNDSSHTMVYSCGRGEGRLSSGTHYYFSPHVCCLPATFAHVCVCVCVRVCFVTGKLDGFDFGIEHRPYDPPPDLDTASHVPSRSWYSTAIDPTSRIGRFRSGQWKHRVRKENKEINEKGKKKKTKTPGHVYCSGEFGLFIREPFEDMALYICWVCVSCTNFA